jgi:hypothetical protein
LKAITLLYIFTSKLQPNSHLVAVTVPTTSNSELGANVHIPTLHFLVILNLSLIALSVSEALLVKNLIALHQELPPKYHLIPISSVLWYHQALTLYALNIALSNSVYTNGTA